MNILLCLSLLLNSSIYDIQVKNIDGNTVSMNQYRGKKILLVNIATGSPRVDQLAGLQQLHQQHGNNLVIIGFPTNSFGHESRDNASIKTFCHSQYGVTFLLAEKNPIAGPTIQPLYNWLINIGENGVTGDAVRNDFQKFLINETGQLVGIFSPSVAPMSDNLLSALVAE